ncbi:hypothetical protein NUW54_g6799 [Trametes sanguinea]|uniref:Uncharacterized protein n=1 Tax=Trametes sanguinea TaxID=158606 RepID=A0ACC1PSX0_9APHY|nr:hypothetical protein NUW54_g6799 [Trametes sanguinea]
MQSLIGQLLSLPTAARFGQLRYNYTLVIEHRRALHSIARFADAPASLELDVDQLYLRHASAWLLTTHDTTTAAPIDHNSALSQQLGPHAVTGRVCPGLTASFHHNALNCVFGIAKRVVFQCGIPGILSIKLFLDARPMPVRERAQIHLSSSQSSTERVQRTTMSGRYYDTAIRAQNGCYVPRAAQMGDSCR